MIVVFLDSNVLISALIGSPQSAPVILVDWLAGNSSARLVTARCCVREVEKNVTQKLPQALPLWKQFLAASGIEIVPCPQRVVSGINGKDAAIVAAAISAKATHFVTGDKRLLAEMRAGKSRFPPAVSPRGMLEAMVVPY